MLKHHSSEGPAELQQGTTSLRQRQAFANPILVLHSGATGDRDM